MVRIRNIRQQDVPSVQRYASDPSIGQTSNVPSPYPIDGAMQWYSHVQKLIAQGSSQVFVIEYLGQFAGIISLNNICFDQSRANIDYWVREDLQAKGIATSALRLALQGLKEEGIRNCFSGCLARNIGSQKVLLNNGFGLDQTIEANEGKFKGETLTLFSGAIS
ncbi:GNAT family N-acetyltransferase [Alginatibacterium sediminis]|uniref:GNAT family N-acetyltransferase n=1 Tax=Alginatibacterium sediminis TaxID=2164068 RepID=UPI001314D7EA|nr:GNAT family N-acetyltransferase [Alginatibacterium sediminis]